MKKIIIGTGIILLVGGIFFFTRASKTQQTVEKTATVQKGTFTVPLTLSGQIKASEQYTVRFQTTGLVSGVYAAKGDTVRKYQRLASLDQRKLKNDMQQLLNTYMDTRWDFDQTKADNQTTVDTAAQQAVRERAKRLIEQSQFALNNSVLDVEAQDLALQFAHLTSPINGIVTKAPSLTAGMNITLASQGEFEITNPDSLYFEALADQTEVTTLSQGITSHMVLDAYPDATVTGEISSISFTPQEGEVGTVYAIDISLNRQTNINYLLGMTGDVTFTTHSKENALFIPLAFLQSKNGKRFVKIKKNNTIIEQEVQTGLENDTDIEILTGISEGTVVYD